MRSTPQQKARFAALAALHHLSESALLARLVETVLDHNPASDAPEPVETFGMPKLRITLRLRPGDHARVCTRAAARGLKPASYLAALIHAHVRGTVPMPMAEIEVLKTTVAQLSALTRQLDRCAATGGSCADGLDLRRALHDTRQHVDGVRRQIAEIVRTNLISWESDDG